jgi:colanic acid biosynthesis glycosyl transferase WcaI
MNKARILLLGGNYFPEPTGIGKYNGEMMEWLSEQGHDCAVITSYPYYPHWKAQEPYNKISKMYTKEEYTYEESSLKIYRCPHYIPSNPSGTKRMISDLSFFISAFFPLFTLLFKKKYDIVITVVPFFKMGLLGLLYKRVKRAKFIYHIQDLQIDAAKELQMIDSKLLFKLMFRVEKYILGKADHISSISDGMIKKIVAKCGKPVILFPNWVDTENFYPLPDQHLLKAKYNFSPDDKIILYSGAIGQKQGLENILLAARDINRDNVKFVICGSGPYKDVLYEKMNSMGLQNVIFLPLQPKENLNEFLNLADVHLVLQRANANDLVMPSKLTNIFAVGGLALVAASHDSSLNSIVSTHNMAIVATPENIAALTEAVRHSIDQEHTEIRKNARSFALNYLKKDKVMNRFLEETSIVKLMRPGIVVNLKNEVKADATT